MKNNIMTLKEDIALKIFNSKTGNFNDLKRLNAIFDLIFKIIKLLEINIQKIKYNTLSIGNVYLV